MAKSLGKATKVGKIENCFVPSEMNLETAYIYCQENFVDDRFRFDECRSPDNFCYVCCENEFGDLHILERDSCYNKCDKK
jgi:hypothetical protein